MCRRLQGLKLQIDYVRSVNLRCLSNHVLVGLDERSGVSVQDVSDVASRWE